jgi:hypothetical protein
MKKILMMFLVMIFMTPGLIFSDVVSFRLGYFTPRAESDLWQIEFENMTFMKSDFQNALISFSYEHFINPQISFALSVDAYNQQKAGFYQGYVGYADSDGDWAYPDIYVGDFDPSHSFSVTITPIQASVKFTPFGRSQKIIPYVGGGVGVYIWNVKLQGDMVDFSDEWYDVQEGVTIYPIYAVDAREESRTAIGFHGFGGIMVPVGRRISLEGEFKYNSAKGNFSDDAYASFEGFEAFDLSGYTISVGLNYWF